MERQPLQNDLDPLLRAAGLEEPEIEVLMNLALGPADVPDLRLNAKLTDEEDAERIVAHLCRRGLVRKGASDDPRFRLAAPSALETCLPGDAGGRLAMLARATRHAFIPAVVLNPALPMPGNDLGGPYAEYRAAFDERLPQVEIRAQTVCNLGCVYCFIRKDPRDNQSTRSLERQFQQAMGTGVNRLILTGGEPTMRRDLPSLIRMARSVGFVDIQLFTNGLMFSYPEVLAAVVEAGLTSMCLHATTIEPRMYHRLAGRDCFSVLESAVAQLSRYPQMEITVLSVVNRLSLRQLPETVAYFRGWQRRVGFKRFVTQLIQCCVYSSSWDHRAAVLGPLTESVPVVTELIEAYRHEEWPIMVQNIPMCMLPGKEAHSYDLYLTFARRLLRAGRFDFTPLDTMFLKPQRCRSCVHEPYCVGLPRGYARLFGSDELRPVTPSGAGGIR